MTTCLKCKSTRIKTGKIIAETVAVFQPDDLRPLVFSWTGGTSVGDEAFACLDCGLVWSWTSPVELSEFVRKHCTQISDTSEA